MALGPVTPARRPRGTRTAESAKCFVQVALETAARASGSTECYTDEHSREVDHQERERRREWADMTEPAKGPASYFPSIEKKYGRSIDE